jgi:hypothetical protein
MPSQKNQSLIATSTVESELYAQHDASGSVIALRQFLAELGFPQIGPTVQFCDNKNTVSICRNNCQRHRTKHIDVKFLSIRERQALGYLTVKHTSGASMLADLFTKPLPKARFLDLRHRIGVQCHGTVSSVSVDEAT